MKIEKTTKNNNKLNFLDWIIHMIAYTLILIVASLIFKKTIQVNKEYFGLWAFCASIIIYLLNKTIKPFIVWLTLPITAITLGLFYPVINVLILNIVDVIMFDKFNIRGFIMSFIVALLISIVNEITTEIILKPLIKRGI